MKTLALLLALFSLSASAEPEGAPMAGALGVQIEKPAGDDVHFLHGSGVFLGGGMVLTAAHVVKINPQDPGATVIMDGWKTAARVAAIAPNGLDLALLKIDPSEISAQRRMLSPVHLCSPPIGANQPVIVASEGQISFSVTIPVNTGQGITRLGTGYPHGASGGGIFDASKGCLAGIIIIADSGTLSGQDIKLTEFIPATQIAPFLAASLH